MLIGYIVNVSNQSLKKILPFSVYLGWLYALEKMCISQLCCNLAEGGGDVAPRAVYLSLGKAARMIPFLHQLVSRVATPHPWEGEKDRGRRWWNSYEKDFGEVLPITQFRARS